MQFRSTPKSIADGEITMLALAECVLSAGIYLLIAMYTKTWLHFIVAAAFAPMFLFRTRFSTKLALGRWKNMWKYVDRVEMPEKGFGGDDIFVLHKTILMDMTFFVAAVFVRIYATIIGIARHPMVAIMSIPDNWKRQTLYTDFSSVPELIPGEASDKGAGSKIPSFASLRADVVNYAAPLEGKVARLLLLPVLVFCLFLCYVPTIILRVSFKSTAFCYLPLLFVAQRARIGKDILKWRLDRIVNSQVEKLRRAAFIFVIPTHAAIVGFQYGLVSREFIESKVGSHELSELMIVYWPLWGSAWLVELLLTFSLLFAADTVRSGIDRPQSRISEGKIASLFSFVLFLRGTIASVMAICLFGAAVAALRHHFSGAI